MSDSLLPYYNRELAALRRDAGAFAEAYPKVAGRLRLSGDAADDPYVERLLEGVAFLAARAQQRLDDELPELSDAPAAGTLSRRGIDRDGFGMTKPEANLPDWLAARWQATYGDEAFKGLAEATRFEPATDITVKPDVNASELAEALEAKVLEGGTLRTDRRGDVSQWPQFEDGTWWVQDAAAAIPARLLDVKAGQTALDLCAAPGGKTLQLAAAGAKVVALDRSESRLKRLRQNFERMKLEAEVVAIPAEDWEDDRQFEAVLLDAPCSATGTYRRNPEALRAVRPADIAKLADVQHRLIDVAAQKVKVGGKLVYCVCSLEREEGETQMLAFLRRNAGFKTIAADPAKVGAPTEALTKEGWLRVLPGQWDDKGSLDGFFIALLERTA